MTLVSLPAATHLREASGNVIEQGAREQLRWRMRSDEVPRPVAHAVRFELQDVRVPEEVAKLPELVQLRHHLHPNGRRTELRDLDLHLREKLDVPRRTAGSVWSMTRATRSRPCSNAVYQP